MLDEWRSDRGVVSLDGTVLSRQLRLPQHQPSRPRSGPVSNSTLRRVAALAPQVRVDVLSRPFQSSLGISATISASAVFFQELFGPPLIASPHSIEDGLGRLDRLEDPGNDLASPANNPSGPPA